MISSENIMPLIQSLIWLLAGVGVFIVGMNFLSEALEKSAGNGMKRLLEKISNKKYSISLMSSKPFSYEIEYLNKLF